MELQEVIEVLKRIPKGSRIRLCNVLTELLDNVTLKNDLESWDKLLKFPNLCLKSTNRAGKKKKSLATVVNSRVDLFLTNSFEPEIP